MTHRPRRARSRALRRGITDFPAVLRSSHPGIRFTATLTATLLTEPDDTYDTDTAADQIRAALRATAADTARTHDPADLPSASDAVNRHLRTPHTTATGAQVTATAHLTLAPDDERAVAALLDAARTQSVEDALAQQRNDAAASQLAHPAALLARLLRNPVLDISALPKEDELADIAQRLSRYPHTTDEPLEVQVLATLRNFFDQFPREEQKRMLLQLLADSMRAARQPAHATRIENLLRQTPAASHLPQDA
ncbi:hypothetical protein [Streptomyces anthocyanicus]|uniref:hypothetical protein n=1 Tax=Streptomyces anthocyanicus TaxID=68174 RepID=UPI0038061F69